MPSDPDRSSVAFAELDVVADALVALPGARAVALGGSRAQGTNRPDSDWDVAVYYRGGFDPQGVRDLGWPGQLSEIGGWGRVFNGGGKLSVDGQVIDVHYRDLDLVDAIHDNAVRGEFTIEPLLFHQAGLPSYILLAELGIDTTLRGQLPEWGYPPALRASAPPIWWGNAVNTLEYADAHARHGRVAQCAGLLSEAACHAAHAILAHRGEWVTNEKQLLTAAGLRGIDRIIGRIGTEPSTLVVAATESRELLVQAGRGEGLPW
ncbi:nucleotidyltransferase domain-containing protein [Frondihabitans sp. PAMC 28766]|uniref:nucleotidyltransferase domain-containing protein n=1 Tax=Frondihabitans sp. PAMC 28766 TaxID=1795630 RepID=UPI00194EE5CC|nr:nucleotidyltransferase domain-containing protein [Frondihabitans sp. PAMC 28766]